MRMSETNVTVAQVARIIKKMNKNYENMNNTQGIQVMNDFADNFMIEVRKTYPEFDFNNFYTYCKGHE